MPPFISSQNLLTPGPLHIASTGQFGNAGLLQRFLAGSVNLTTAVWPSNNLAVYAPIQLPFIFTVAQFMVANGTNATGSIDVGLYSESGSRLMSTGTQSRTGTSVVQYYGITDQTFPPGRYYLGLVASSTTGSYGTVQLGSQYEARFTGYLQEALGSTVLPVTMTPVSFTGLNLYCFGFTQSNTL